MASKRTDGPRWQQWSLSDFGITGEPLEAVHSTDGDKIMLVTTDGQWLIRGLLAGAPELVRLEKIRDIPHTD